MMASCSPCVGIWAEDTRPARWASQVCTYSLGALLGLALSSCYCFSVTHLKCWDGSPGSMLELTADLKSHTYLSSISLLLAVPPPLLQESKGLLPLDSVCALEVHPFLHFLLTWIFSPVSRGEKLSYKGWKSKAYSSAPSFFLCVTLD